MALTKCVVPILMHAIDPVEAPDVWRIARIAFLMPVVTSGVVSVFWEAIICMGLSDIKTASVFVPVETY